MKIYLKDKEQCDQFYMLGHPDYNNCRVYMDIPKRYPCMAVGTREEVGTKYEFINIIDFVYLDDFTQTTKTT